MSKPWQLICKTITSSDRTIVDAEGRHIADIYSGFANAQALVQAVNAHDTLLAALRSFVGAADLSILGASKEEVPYAAIGRYVIDQARAAIAQVSP